MPGEIWHEPHQGGKRTSTEVIGRCRGKIFDPVRHRRAVIQGKFTNDRLQERNLSPVRVDQPDIAVSMTYGEHDTRQSSAAADVEPLTCRMTRKIGKLKAVTDMALFKIA